MKHKFGQILRFPPAPCILLCLRRLLEEIPPGRFPMHRRVFFQADFLSNPLPALHSNPTAVQQTPSIPCAPVFCAEHVYAENKQTKCFFDFYMYKAIKIIHCRLIPGQGKTTTQPREPPLHAKNRVIKIKPLICRGDGTALLAAGANVEAGVLGFWMRAKETRNKVPTSWGARLG